MDTPHSQSTAPTPPTAGNNWRLYLELLSFAGLVFPFGNILGPLVLWLVKKDSDATVDAEGKKVLNFNLSWTIWMVVTCGLGLIPWFIIAIIATVKAANNKEFKHPLAIQFLK